MPQNAPGYDYFMITIPCIMSYWLTNKASALLFRGGTKISARDLTLEWERFFEVLQITSLVLIIASLKLWGHQVPVFISYWSLYQWCIKTEPYPDMYLGKDMFILNCLLCIYIADLGYTAEQNYVLWRGFCSPDTDRVLHLGQLLVLCMGTVWRDLCSASRLHPLCPHTVHKKGQQSQALGSWVSQSQSSRATGLAELFIPQIS